MTITALRILPPLAIGRLGSAAEPLDNYVVTVESQPMDPDPDVALPFRSIQGAETLVVDEANGEIIATRPASSQPPLFKDGDHIRPVAPFLEVFAVADNGEAVALTVPMLEQAKLSLRWRVEVGNFKMFRRTGDVNDQIHADTGYFSDNGRRALAGGCVNFVSPDKAVTLGWVQAIKPNAAYPQIRLRFTPAAGLVYGSTPLAEPIHVPDPSDGKGQSSDVALPPERVLYDSARGSWHGHRDDDPIRNTLGQGLYAAYGATPYFNYYDEAQPSRGYFDDTCDGIVTIELIDQDGAVQHSARARICSAPPIFAPDSGFIRSMADELEQALDGPEVAADEVSLAEAEDIIRRAYETVRFMNIPVLNGGPIDGAKNVADTMPANDSEDFDRLEQQSFDPALDTRAALSRHKGVLSAVQAGGGSGFAPFLRQPEEIGDLSDDGRHKMPALMSGADARYLTLTRRQLDIIGKAGPDSPLVPRNRTAQLTHQAQGNPPNAGIASAVGNCCPGLELDFRSVWRRVFEGITLVEHTNYVVQADPAFAHLLDHRLLKIDGRPLVFQATGPSQTHPEGGPLKGDGNPNGVVCMEWSNALAYALQKQGQSITCEFTKAPSPEEVLGGETITCDLVVRRFFEDGTAVIAREMAAPGEMTQGLCSPWQNDFRECVCYYWASSRPDYVNVEPVGDEASTGDNWMQKARTGLYVVDDYQDSRLIGYKDLFENWEGLLRFQIGGKDRE